MSVSVTLTGPRPASSSQERPASMGSGTEWTGARNGRASSRAALDSAAADRSATRDERLKQLLRTIAAGDETAFAQLYDDVSPRVFGLARRVAGGSSSLAEDITQEVMVEIWRTAPRFDGARGSAIGWILMLTHRRAVDRVRSSSARRAREQRDSWARPVQEPIDEQLVVDDDHRELRGALDRLTAVQREAIELAYYQGYTYREVARVLDVPEGTAKSRLRDGLRRLRATLEGNR